MKFNAVNPHIRFAEQINYRSKGKLVLVKDCRVFYIISGHGVISIAGKKYRLLPGTLFFCRENSVYAIESNGITLLSLNFDLGQSRAEMTNSIPPVVVENEQLERKCLNETITDCDSFNSHLYIENGETYFDVLQSIVSEFAQRRIYFREKSSGILKDLLTELARDCLFSTDNSTNAIFQAIAYINQNLEKNLTNKQLANKVGYHEYHLNRLFLKHTGKSIHQYILTRRLNEAKRLLLNTTLPMGEIAECVGFNSISHFSSYFKQVVGITPYQYRMKFQNRI